MSKKKKLKSRGDKCRERLSAGRDERKLGGETRTHLTMWRKINESFTEPNNSTKLGTPILFF